MFQESLERHARHLKSELETVQWNKPCLLYDQEPAGQACWTHSGAACLDSCSASARGCALAEVFSGINYLLQKIIAGLLQKIIAVLLKVGKSIECS